MAWNPIGKVTVATPGTLVQINPQATNFVRATTLVVSTVGNTGNVFIGKKGMVRATGVGVLAVIGPNASPQQIGDQGAGMQFDTTDLYIDANTGNDSAFFSYFD